MWWQYAIIAVVVAGSAAIVVRALIRTLRAKSCSDTGCGCSATRHSDPLADRRGREIRTVPLNITRPHAVPPKC